MAAPIVDFHCDTLTQLLRHGGSLAVRPEGQLDAARLKTAGVTLQVFALFSHPKSMHSPLADALLMTELFWQAADAGIIQPILWREDLTSLTEVPGGILAIEGGEPLGTDLRMLALFHRLGVRVVGLTWNGANALADGVEVTNAGGLTSFGRDMVLEMNRMGILVDVSHLAEPGFWQVAELYRGPIIASHSNCRALCPHIRNLSDEQLKAIAATGGVVGLNFYPRFLSTDGEAEIKDILRHAEHMLRVMGRGHIGLGSDFDGISITPTDLPDVSALPRLAEALVGRFGMEIAAEIMGGSFFQLLQRTLPSHTQ